MVKWTPLAVIAWGVFFVYLAKKIVHFTKNQLFYKKKSGKNLVVSKKRCTFAPLNK